MTEAERFDLVCGADMGIAGIPRLGLPSVRFADASAGLRRCDSVTRKLEKTTSFPCPLLLAATWDRRTARDYARMIGEECRAAGVHLLLGPGMNMYRHSRYGRNFEYFGEDPLLASAIAEAYVTGLQSTGTGATIKHWIGNETDLKRCSSNTRMSEKALREIYMPPFEASLRAGARALMTAYNLFNGEWCAQSRYLNMELLRKELAFDGLIMTDWHSAYDGKKLSESGVDLEMPDGLSLKLARSALLGSPRIDRMALSILKTCVAAGYYDPNYAKPSLLRRLPQHAALARRTNEQGITLLKNNGILPMRSKPSGGPILVTGNAATRVGLGGGGSAFVIGYNNKSYLEVMQERWGTKNIIHAANPSTEELQRASCVLVFSAFGGDDPEAEGHDHSFTLPDDALIHRCAEGNPNTVVCIVTGCGVSMEWDASAAAVMWLGLGGQTGPDAFADILSGKVSPSGKLPFTIERRFEDSPGFGYDRASLNRESPHAIADTVTKSKRVEFHTNKEATEYYTYDVEYREGIHIGYRWYDKKAIPVRYPFGHGLGYTRFHWSDLKTVRRNGKMHFSFNLANTGGEGGAEVVQVYSSAPETAGDRPVKELKAFLRVYLESGDAKRVRLSVRYDDLRHWDSKTQKWVFTPGRYTFRIGGSSADLPLEAKVFLPS